MTIFLGVYIEITSFVDEIVFFFFYTSYIHVLKLPNKHVHQNEESMHDLLFVGGLFKALGVPLE